ncbi:MAG TPA: phosphoadenylyl-sulfate reductase [Limnochordales bacterium]
MPEDGAAIRARLAEVADRLETASPEAVLAWALETYGERVCLACSFGAEDMVLLDMGARMRPGLHVFYLDTGLLFQETYRLIQQAAALYPIRLIRVLPLLSLDEQARQHGEALWSRDPDLCCRLRKVEPLRRFLQGYGAWITGLRRQQSPLRAGTRPVEWDARFGLAKVNPLFRWSRDDVWRYIREHQVPYNPLHDRGYPSIGCRPCTTPVAPGEDERAGRWRGFGKTECGLHRPVEG